jgi:Ca-activated chloride channel homolog
MKLHPGPRTVRLTALALLLAALPAARSATLARAQQEEGYHLSVGVALNTVTVAVLDERGRYRTDLEQQDFELLVDGNPVEIADFSRTTDDPFDLAVLLDVSGSMRFDGKLEKARWVLGQLAGRMREGERAALMIFADGRIEAPVPFTEDRGHFLETLGGIEAYGKTALIDAMAEAADVIDRQQTLSPSLILLTDAFDNASEGTMAQTLAHLRFRGVPVYPLALVAEHLKRDLLRPDAGSDLDLLKRIAAETGGRFFAVTSPASMAAAVNGIETDLRSRYRLGYYGKDDETRPSVVTVNVRKNNFRVRYRRGWKPAPGLDSTSTGR